MTKRVKILTGLSKSELNSKLSELNLELIKLNAQVATGTALKNPSQLKDTKKTIARIHTLLKIKEENKKKNNE